MENIFDFLIEVGSLKGKPRRGWIIHKIKNPETTAEHIFHLAILVWVLGEKKKINIDKAIKIALVHDLCEVYAKDLTSYDAAALKKEKITEKELLEIKPVRGRPTTEQRKKMEKLKHKMEMKGLKKLTSKLPPNLKKEINNLWLEYENRSTPEGKFVKQADRMINLIQGLEYWRKFGNNIQYKLWIARAEEEIDDPVLVEFLKEVEKKELKSLKKIKN